MTVSIRCSAVALVLALVAGTLFPAGAQSSTDTGVIQITVRDAGGNQTLGDARVFLMGPTVASALTNTSGIVKYTDVPSGIYRVRVSKPSYTGVTSKAFEVLQNKQVDVDVDLGQQQPQQAQNAPSDTSGLKVIGTVKTRVVINTTDVDDNSGVRKISDSLTDALGTIAGVDVTTDSNDPNSPQTISLRGHDESQTAVTLDGIPLGAPGAATDLRKVNTDLFSGAGVSFGAQAGALGGAVNFRTLQPTQTWQTQLSSSYGTFDKYNYRIGETGSLGKLGIAFLHTKRAGNSPLTFQDYADQSGIDYAHGGESANVGDFLKLRYGLGDNTTLLFTALQNNQSSTALCTQFVTPLPCGIGPGNGSSGKFQFMYGTVQSLIGMTALSVSAYVNDNASLTSDLNRYIAPAGGGAPILSPFASQQSTIARGFASSATLTKDKHTITLSGSTYAGVTNFTPLVNPSGFVVASTTGTASRQLQLADQYKVNDKLSVGPNLSYAGTSGAGSSLLAGFSASWRPSGNDIYHGSLSFGSSQPTSGVVRSFSDPNAARINCFAQTATVNGPGDQPSHQGAASYDVGWTHLWSHGQVSIQAYQQTQSNQLINALVTGTSLGIDNPFNPYYQAVAGYFGNVCGTAAGLPQLYVQQLIGNTTRLYQGYTATARFALGPNVVVIPSYSTTVAEITSANPLYTGLDSTLILDEQIPGRPLHTGNLTVDAFHPRSGLEFLVNAHYVGSNNAQHISPYVLVNAGISHKIGIGQLTVFASNLFNTEAGTFSTLQYAQPLALSGGGSLVQAAIPNAPRQYTVSFSFNTGARSGAGFARARSGAAQTAAASEDQNQRQNQNQGQSENRQRGLFGFGQLKFIAPPAGTDPLSVATSRPECTADLQPIAQSVLAQLGAAAKAYAAGEPLPAVQGVSVTPHGDRTGTWWFGLGPQIPENLLPQRRQGAPGQPGFGPGGGRFGRGPGGAEPTGGFQPRVSVGPNENQNGPRPQFSPSPQLIAAIQPFRALASCSYGTVLTPADAKAQGYDVPTPGARPSPEPSSAPAPRQTQGDASNRRGRFGNIIDYSPKLGIFVVRPPQLGPGGGSVKQ
jgi:hypothetical protein